jgi:hypothetical protein
VMGGSVGSENALSLLLCMLHKHKSMMMDIVPSWSSLSLWEAQVGGQGVSLKRVK